MVSKARLPSETLCIANNLFVAVSRLGLVKHQQTTDRLLLNVLMRLSNLQVSASMRRKCLRSLCTAGQWW